MRRMAPPLVALSLLLAAAAHAADGNRLAYLDGSDPYHVGLASPRLTTPQWAGEPGVEAVVVLAIDDMRATAPYEAYLRPILDRLKRIDGRAPVSIMANTIDPADPRLQAWRAEGVQIDAHTLTHPCPLLQKGDFAAAAREYHGSVDLLHRVGGNRPVAFRMPCCDSLNTPSPRFYAEIFGKASPEGHFLSIDSSVFNVLTPDDPALPRALVQEPDGRERFRKYLPFPSFVNTIENYPYPYVIGRTCWEFPCVVPSDWEGQHLQKPANPKTLEDMKAALDAVVLKQGVFNLVFHPYGWITSAQVVELIDHAVETHGPRVKFLNFREALERLEKNLLGGQPLRAADGGDNGVRLLDLDGDGFMDVASGNQDGWGSRRWDPKAGAWSKFDMPFSLIGQPAARGGDGPAPGRVVEEVAFGVVRPDGHASAVWIGPGGADAWHFTDRGWAPAPELKRGLEGLRIEPIPARSGPVPAVRLRDLDGDGRCELLAGRGDTCTLHAFDEGTGWRRLPFGLPAGARLADESGRDAGLRFIDLDEDGRGDVVYSNDSGHGIFLFDSMTSGWSRRVASGGPDDADALPKIARGGTNNGFWAHSRHLWWQNEDTASRPDHVDRRAFNDLLRSVEPRAKSPEASRRSIRARPGFRVELAASEPLVRDPIAFDWGADGRLWVVEMGDYPLGGDGKGRPDGRIRVLDDVNSDGKYDRSTVFLDGLAFPAGLLPWRGGVLVACAPDIFYAEDRDGDGRADVREVLFTGFQEGNPQHRVNGFELGLDGWVYGANGDSGGNIRSVKTGKVVDIRGRDFRFRPDDGAFEAESGQTQYGRHRDDWGDWFGNHNSTWAWQYPLADRELRRNPRLALPDARKYLDGDNKLYPVSRTAERFNDPQAANRVTSANSATPYRDDLFGPAFAGNVFISEPVHNLVHRLVLDEDGATYKGRRAAGEVAREFLASSDAWTRPTMLKTGPDGALWVADMYRAVIEHPEWIPDDWEAKLDLRAGHDMGRIYRVVPVGGTPRPIPRLDRLDTGGLVAALDSPSGCQRDTAQRLLLHRKDRAAVAPLRRLAANGQHPQTRAQALWVLAGLGALEPADVVGRLEDPDPRVRGSAAQVAGQLSDRATAVLEALAKRANDPEPRVRFRAAVALGDWDDPRAGRALAALARRDGADPWMRAAILSSAAPHAATILATLFDGGNGEPPRELVGPLFATLGAGPAGAGVDALARALATPRDGRFAGWQFAALAGWLDADGGAEVLRSRGDALRPAFEAAHAVAADDTAEAADRLAAIRLLGRSGTGDRAALLGLLRPQVGVDLQRAAVASLARSSDPKVAEALLSDWKSYGPTLRSAVLDALLGRDAWAGALLSAVEAGRVPAAEVGPAARRRLLESRSEDVRRRARSIFEATEAGRQAVVDRYQEALKSPGDPAAGVAVFKRACAACHRLAGVGSEVGPDLATLTDRSPTSLLVAVLDPNRAFEAKYADFTVQTTDGRVLNGLIAAETANSVTLRRQEGQEDVLLRPDIEAMAGSGRSLMPEGLEKDLTPRDVADLIAYLGTLGPPPKPVAGNAPATARPGADGRLVLGAESAEIRGASLTLEPMYRNLGFWSAPDDRAAWTLEVERPGRYAVWFEYACADDSAGNRYVLDAGPGRIAGTVAGTGSWDQYRTARVGDLNLPAGRQRLELRPDGPIRGALIDLKRIELRPER